MEQLQNSGFYCEICNGCGEEGCCSPLNCVQSSQGLYCASYLKDLQFGYKMYRKLQEFIDSRHWDSDGETNEIFNQVYKEVYDTTT